jgi:hypothetical protein
MVGPGRILKDPLFAGFTNKDFNDPLAKRSGSLLWKYSPDSVPQEVLYFERETPHRKYGIGLLHPSVTREVTGSDQEAMVATDTLGVSGDDDSAAVDGEVLGDLSIDSEQGAESDDLLLASLDGDDFEVTSSDLRHPSSAGISFCVRLNPEGRIVVRLPLTKRFLWQTEDSDSFQLNGRYELSKRLWTDEKGEKRESPIWRRCPAVPENTVIFLEEAALVSGKVLREKVSVTVGSPMSLRFEVFPRQLSKASGEWLITIVLRNDSVVSGLSEPRDAILYQTYFEVAVEGGVFQKYPESRRPFPQLDNDEQSLAVLYRESATWAIGHGCSAGWDADLNETPQIIFADVMPATELPSMTPDIELDGSPIQLSMREFASLSDSGIGAGWDSIESLLRGYEDWILRGEAAAAKLPADFIPVAQRHFAGCRNCLKRMTTGMTLLRSDERVRKSFRLANLSMLLQQISSKQLKRRPLQWDGGAGRVVPAATYESPWRIFEGMLEDPSRVGSWRAFQVAFLLMSMDGVRNGDSGDREIVDLIWFPTGGGKTEAYLAVMAFYMFHERLLIEDKPGELERDGTNVLMRYTLRMLTTQQFQRAASLICAMEFLRRKPETHAEGSIPGRRFSLGLWVGGDGSPNKIADANAKLAQFRNGVLAGNPLVLTECPWCRSEIGRFDGGKPSMRPAIKDSMWNSMRLRGIDTHHTEGPRLLCSDSFCAFGQQDPSEWLPVEVIDERIYSNPTSLIIATADKLAMISYRPDAGALFGKYFDGRNSSQRAWPPSLIVQDELHLISGPLGTMYALYEGVIERLCSVKSGDKLIKPKIIASTATIRGASDQVMALYARTETQLFPNPGLSMGDSFFGKYARDKSGKLSKGRLYLGIHASDYGSVLTTQVRAFSSALFRPWLFNENRRDAWWTLLAFYNSIRELGGAKTLFDSDIRSRLKFVFNREGIPPVDRRSLRIVEELTSRLSQAEIVTMMDRLSAAYQPGSSSSSIDACLASNIIEVGVDIDRLSLMGIVGQPKTTATYIQVSGRVGRKWWERPGLILMMYNPSKSRDRSHFEQFHSYHRRLYERVEPTSVTPFAPSAIQRGASGVLLAWARQISNETVRSPAAYANAIDIAHGLLRERCLAVQIPEDQSRSIAELDRVREELLWKWSQHPQAWEEFPQRVTGEYLMLWPGQYATSMQFKRGVVVPSSMRQVDRAAELTITQGYASIAIPHILPKTSTIDIPVPTTVDAAQNNKPNV